MDNVSAHQHPPQAVATTKAVQDTSVVRARRTAFVARFIVLRESKRSRAHRRIEMLAWNDDATAEDIANMCRVIFKENGDNMRVVENDIRKAMSHADRSLKHFYEEYAARATNDFIHALHDYERSNALLFGDDDAERPTSEGWRHPKELARAKGVDLKVERKWAAF